MQKSNNRSVSTSTSKNPTITPESFRQWLDSMPGAEKGEITIPVNLTLNIHAWLVYTRGARARNQSVEETLAAVLGSEDLAFEDRHFQTVDECDSKPAIS